MWDAIRKWLRSVRGARRPTLFTLQVGDSVSLGGTKLYTVIGLLRYDDEGWQWIAYQLSDFTGKRLWLAVEQDDALEVGLYEEVDDLDLGGRPPRQIEYRGRTYRLEEHSDAVIVQAEGQVGARVGARLDYWDYAASDEEFLSVERWSGEYEVSLGHALHPDIIECIAQER
ncbi:MAG: DUF4178 domain-containing protein [Bacillota bacterium]